MAEFFLHPGFLWFALAGAIPIIIHLLNRQKYRRVRWAAMEFLLAAIRKMRRRLQLENLLLLLVRIAILVVLAVALSRPLLQSAPAAALEQSDNHLVLVLDQSFSMGYRTGQKTPLDRAKAVAIDLLDGLKVTERDRASVILSSDAPVAVIGPPTNDIGRAKTAVADAALSDRGNRLGALLPVLQEVLEKSDNRLKSIVLLTDLQRAAWDVPDAEAARVNEAFKALTSRPGVTFTVFDVGMPDPQNRAVVRFAADSGVITTHRPVSLSAEVRNFSAEHLGALAVSLFVDDDRKQTLSLPLDAGTSGQVTFTYEFPEAGPHALRVELDPDFLAADDRRSLAVDVRDQVRILAVDGEEGGAGLQEDETYFFWRALSPSRDVLDRNAIFHVEKLGPLAFASQKLDKADIVVLANVGELSEERVEAIETFVRDGGGLIVTLGDQVVPEAYNRLLWKDGRGLLPLKLGEPSADYAWDRPVGLGRIDFDHPALRFFKPFETVFGSLLTFGFFRTVPPGDDAGVRILGRYEDRDDSPWLAEREYGRGRVLLLTTTLDGEWNHMPKSPPYAVLWNEIGKALASRPYDLRNLEVGEWIRMTIRERDYARSFRLETPGEGFVSLIPAKIGDDRYLLQFPGAEGGGPEGALPEGTAPSSPPPPAPGGDRGPAPRRESRNDGAGVAAAGIYRLQRPEGNAGDASDTLACFAANVRTEESDLERTSEAEIRRRYPGFHFRFQATSGGETERVRLAAPESNLWRFALYAVLMFLAVESVMAWKFNRS